ncbi:hypothetical protein [Bifidobacterium bohemicum]|uniref:hypothetical protein n=1 Tax=Bifidobacterium bohemicum TaxID=638617 RepID=UPI0015CF4726|nr:hypothetical protein [Bifidobacterium bohemicum]
MTNQQAMMPTKAIGKASEMATVKAFFDDLDATTKIAMPQQIPISMPTVTHMAQSAGLPPPNLVLVPKGLVLNDSVVKQGGSSPGTVFIGFPVPLAEVGSLVSIAVSLSFVRLPGASF